jgi:hypothetical protein
MHEESENMNPRDDETAPADAAQLSSELQSFEAALAQLRPSPAAIERDRLMFLAGQASARRAVTTAQRNILPGWFWPASSAVMTGVAAALLFMLAMRTPVIGERETHQSGAVASDAPAQEFVETPRVASSLAWRKRLTDELLSYDAVANAGADMPGAPSWDADEEIISARSFKQLLDEEGDVRRPPRASNSPKSSG